MKDQRFIFINFFDHIYQAYLPMSDHNCNNINT